MCETQLGVMSIDNKRILVGFSGGIDSTATCLMLMDQGYVPVGVTMQVWGEAPAEAKEMADKLGIEYYIVDERKAFNSTVVTGFIQEYRLGRTPNPCVMCNPLFKFRVLLDCAKTYNCAKIATGHYSLLEVKNNKTYLVAGLDHLKDQSYFLWRLNQEVLSSCIFPLGEFTKTEVREYLKQKGFVHKSEGGESMEVCFINGDYRDFLKEHDPKIDEEIGEGWFVDTDGKKIGTHKGAPYYTIGQRKGLNIALGKPAYVVRINADKNTVMLGDAIDLKAKYMLLENDELVDDTEIFNTPGLTVRIRYRSAAIPCSVKRLDDGRLLVKFQKDASAITPGQSAVFYVGNRVLGGAYIASQKGINWIVERIKDK